MMIGLIKPGFMGPRWVWEKTARSAERAAHTLPIRLSGSRTKPDQQLSA